MTKKWMIYGANGYTAQLVLELALQQGEKPILAGRNAEKVKPLAEKHGLEMRIFDLHNLSAAKEALADVEVVAHLAGPFIHTSKPMIDACLASKTSYLDITGEYPVFEATMARDAEAKQAGVALIPGVGFDVVPTDCVAAKLKAELPDANELELAIGGFGGAVGMISRGTLKTMIEGMGHGSAVRIDGKITPVNYNWRTPLIPFAHGTQRGITLPWGDISTAFYSTGIRNIAVYMAASPTMFKVLDFMRPMFGVTAVRSAMQQLVQWTIFGPNEKARGGSQSAVWGRVKNTKGQAVTITMTGPEGYTMTADSTLKAVGQVMSGKVEPGAYTPSMAFGAGYLDTLNGVKIDTPKKESSFS